ncbi:MAG: ABC transporter permease [Bacteroidaceae bacterium]|nr:ABC transporter permease [Bacteroidaceae bacterium]
MSFEFSIARRIYGQQSDASHRLAQPGVQIAVWGVAVGLMVMILSLCIIRGFKDEIQRKMTGMGGDIEVLNYESLRSVDSMPVEVDSTLLHRLSAIPNIGHVQRFCSKAGMLKTDKAFKAVLMRGVAEEYDTTFITAHLVSGYIPQFTAEGKETNLIVVSQQIASDLQLSTGSRIYAYFFAEKPKIRRFTVAGIYQTYIKDFDQSIVFTDLCTARNLNSWEHNQCSGIELYLNDFSRLQETDADVIQVVNRTHDSYGQTYAAVTIHELYPSIFQWLSLLDTNVWVILILMTALGVFTMTSGLLIIILERTGFIAVLKSQGATNGQLQRIFLHLAMMLVGKGMLYGNIIGFGLAFVQHYTGLFTLDAATYYVNAVPVEFPWMLLILLNIATFAISTLMLTIPTYLVSRIHPAEVMRFE